MLSESILIQFVVFFVVVGVCVAQNYLCKVRLFFIKLKNNKMCEEITIINVPSKWERNLVVELSIAQ